MVVVLPGERKRRFTRESFYDTLKPKNVNGGSLYVPKKKDRHDSGGVFRYCSFDTGCTSGQ